MTTEIAVAYHQREELIDEFWAGEISEASFIDCAIEMGMERSEIDQVIAEVRAEDGTQRVAA